MTARAPSPTPAPTPRAQPASGTSAGEDSARLARQVQILATEHWSLLATRSMSWNESFSRASMFLTFLSGAVVALALVAQATAFGTGFVTFALLLLPLVLGVGWSTFVRLVEVNNEDAYWVNGMNRLRKAYLRIEPELASHFVTGTSDDLPGLERTYAAHGGGIGLHVLVTTPATIAFVDSALLGVLTAIVAMQAMRMEMLPGAPIIGAVAFVAGIAVHVYFGYRSMRSFGSRQHIATPTAFVAADQERRRSG